MLQYFLLFNLVKPAISLFFYLTFWSYSPSLTSVSVAFRKTHKQRSLTFSPDNSVRQQRRRSHARESPLLFIQEPIIRPIDVWTNSTFKATMTFVDAAAAAARPPILSSINFPNKANQKQGGSTQHFTFWLLKQ